MSLNPLAIPEILCNILKYLDIQELLKCRQVCRLWTSETIPFVGQRKLVCISDETKLKQLHDLIKQNENQPFRAFELWSFPINLDTDLNTFLICGPYFHHLTLNFDKETENQLTLRTLRDLLLYYLPNLKSLSLRQLPLTILSQKSIFPPEGNSKFKQPLLPTVKSLTIYSDGDYNSNIIQSLLSATANLQQIIVEYGDEPRDFKRSFLSAIFSCAIHLQNLETLRYFMHDPGAGPNWAWDSDECTKLGDMNLGLKSIKLHPGGKTLTQSVYRLLDKLNNSLEYLKLRVHDQLQCPLMCKLSSVILYDYEGSLVFLDQLPNLRHLGLCEYSPAKFFTPDNVVSKKHHQITSLNLYGSYTISNHLFRAIASTLPCLKVLHYWHINNEKLRIVIENFTLLEELTINVVNVDDEAFTGFPLDLCEQMERLCNYTEYMKNPARFRRTPFIGQLCNLRRLEMHGACLTEWKWSSMSDVSMYLGLIHVTSLTSLSLYEFKWLTDVAIRTLSEKLPLLYLKLDSRAFPENLLTDLRNLRPNMRIENVTDELESHRTFFAHTG